MAALPRDPKRKLSNDEEAGLLPDAPLVSAGLEPIAAPAAPVAEPDVDPSLPAVRFSDAFAEARAANQPSFEWEGKSYNTQLKEDAAKPAAKAPAPPPVQAAPAGNLADILQNPKAADQSGLLRSPVDDIDPTADVAKYKAAGNVGAAERRLAEHKRQTEAADQEQLRTQRAGAAKPVASVSATKQPEGGIGTALEGMAVNTDVGLDKAKINAQAWMSDALDEALGRAPSAEAKALQADRIRKYDQAQNQADAAKPEFNVGLTNDLYDAYVSLAQTAPSLAVGVLTKNPALALSLAGAQAADYLKYKKRGASTAEASLGALGEGAVEVITEIAPMGMLVEKFGKVGAGEFLKGYLGREMIGEQVATLAQDAIDTAIANPKKTWGQYLAERPSAAYQTALAVLVTGGVVSSANTLATGAASIPGKIADAQVTTAADQAKAKALGEWDKAFNPKPRDEAVKPAIAPHVGDTTDPTTGSRADDASLDAAMSAAIQQADADQAAGREVPSVRDIGNYQFKDHGSPLAPTEPSFDGALQQADPEGRIEPVVSDNGSVIEQAPGDNSGVITEPSFTGDQLQEAPVSGRIEPTLTPMQQAEQRLAQAQGVEPTVTGTQPLVSDTSPQGRIDPTLTTNTPALSEPVQSGQAFTPREPTVNLNQVVTDPAAQTEPSFAEQTVVAPEEQAAVDLIAAIEDPAVTESPSTAQINSVAMGLGLEVGIGATPQETIERIRTVILDDRDTPDTPAAPIAPVMDGAVQPSVESVLFGEKPAQGAEDVRQDNPDQQVLDTVAAKYAAAAALPGADVHVQETAARLASVTVVDPATLPDDGSSGSLGKDDLAFLNQLGELTGSQFIPVNAPDMGAEQFVIPGVGRTVYVDVNAALSADPAATAGHETFHIAIHTLRNSPDAADQDIAAILDETLALNLAGKGLAKYRKYYSDPSLPDAKLREEAAADIAGNLHTDPVFWGRVIDAIEAKHGDVGVRKLVNAIKDAYTKLVNIAKGHRFQEGYVKNAEQVREAVAQALIQYYVNHGNAAAMALTKANLALPAVASSPSRKSGPDHPGKGVAAGNKLGFWPALRVKYQGRAVLPKKAPILTGTTNINAARQISAIDGILDRFPLAGENPAEWTNMMAHALGSAEVPVPPYAFMRDIHGTGALDKLATLTQGQIDDATHGFENAAEFRRAYIAGELGVETTGKLFMWSFLSRGVSPYTQESLFIDAFAGAGEWIKMAAAGEFTQDVLPRYSEWAKSVAPKGSGQPGAGATHNLNAFGKNFLLKMSIPGADGVTPMQRLHDMMADPKQTGRQIRREFATFGEGVGIDNKVVSFTLLVAGFPDVMVLDRVQIRQLWDDGRFAQTNLYDGETEQKSLLDAAGRPVLNGKGVPQTEPVKIAGSSLNALAEGARGILVYEALERTLDAKIGPLYAALGRPQDGSIGRYHWETWVADSQQEASHGTLGAILADAQGNDKAIHTVAAKQGEYGAYEYGAMYARNEDGAPWFGYTTATGKYFEMPVAEFRSFLDAVKKPANGVVPTKFKVTESGNAPWYARPEVNRDKLDALAAHWAEQGRRTADEPGAQPRAADRAGAGSVSAVKRSVRRGFDATARRALGTTPYASREGLPGLDGARLSAYSLNPEAREALAALGVSTPDIHETQDAGAFRTAIQAAKAGSPYGAAVYVYETNEYQGMRLFLAEGGKAGFALKGDDIVSVFNNDPAIKGAAHSMLPLAVQLGGRRLDAFDTILPSIYAPHGFKAASRTTWDDQWAPDSWDKATFDAFNHGQPDVVYMAYDQAYDGVYSQEDGKRVDSYDEAVELQDAAVKRSPRRQIDTPEFKKWFGGSKVVDKDGKPLVVYHGTGFSIETFESNRGRLIYFARDITAAEDFADSVAESQNEMGNYDDEIGRNGAHGGAAIYPVYLSVQNPFDPDNVDHVSKLGGTAAREIGFGRGGMYDDVERHQKAIRAAGFDGVYVRERPGVAAEDRDIAVFSPTQIKSAIGNDGSFDAATPDIRKSTRRVTEPGKPGYTDPYDNFETRPDTTEVQRDLGRAALAAAEERIFGRYPVGAGAKPTLLGSGISADFRKDGGTSLVGQKVGSAEDLAILSQVLRDPRFETFRIFYTAGGEIVGEAAYSSRLPGAAYMPDTTPETIKSDMERFVADGYWLEHNHPSGSAIASSADLRLTEALSQGAPGFLGHVIIDHNQFGHITVDPYGNAHDQVIDAPELAEIDLRANHEVPHPFLGEAISSPQVFAGMAKRLQQKDGYVTLIGTDSQQRVTLITEVPAQTLQVAKASREAELRLLARVKRATRETGARNLFAVVPGSLADYRGLTGSGIFLDVVDSDGRSSAAMHGSGRLPETKVEKRGGKTKVAEDSPAEIRVKANQLKAMTEDQRDNLDIYDFGWRAYVLYEAEKMMPKKEGTMKGVNDNNSNTLWEEADAVANINGEPWLATKQEDPDDENDEGLTVWAFTSPRETLGEDYTTAWADKAEAIAEFKDHLAKNQGLPDVKFSLRRGPAPKKTVKAYKLFRMEKSKPGQLFPLFVDANTPVPMGEWLDADEGAMQGDKVKSKIGPLAYRPGWHAGDVPVATHIGSKSSNDLVAPDTRSDNHVWAEVEMAADVDWQAEATKRARRTKAGTIVLNTAHITDQIPVDGFYRYKTNSNMTGSWLIGGAMRVTRILSDAEVGEINGAAGVADLPRATPLDLAAYGIKRSPSRQTDTPEFKKWFGDSKVVDENNKPLVVYHGTGNHFTEFKNKWHGGRQGFYFTPDPETAYEYADGSSTGIAYGDDEVAGGPSIIPVYLALHNPVDVSKGWPRSVAEELQDVVNTEWLTTLPAYDYWLAMDDELGASIRSALEHLGYDGLISSNEYVAFNPTQIKSAIGNNGSFDATSPDIKRSPNRKTSEELAAGHAVMMGQDSDAVVDRLEQAMAETEADFNAAKRGVVSTEETDAGAEALAKRLHWSVEAMQDALARGNIEIGTPGAPQSVPAAELLGAAATTVRVAMAELLQNPEAPHFAKRMASVINLMVATRANLSEIGRALNYAGQLQRRNQPGMTEAERTAKLKKVTDELLADADGIVGVAPAKMTDEEKVVVAAWNEGHRIAGDARNDQAEAIELSEQAQAELDGVRQTVKDARQARDEANQQLRDANAELKKQEERRARAVDRTASAFDITRAEGEARRATNEAKAAKEWEKLTKERLKAAGDRVTRAKDQLQKARDNAVDPAEIKRMEQKARLAEAEATLARNALQDAEQKIRDAERRLKVAQEAEADARGSTPTPFEISQAQGAARRAEQALAKALAELRVGQKELSKARRRLKEMQDRADKAILRLQGIQRQVAQLKAPQFLGKGGVSMAEIEAYLGGPKGMARIQRAMRAQGANLNLDLVAQFFQGVAEAIYAQKLEASKRKKLNRMQHSFMASWLELFRAMNLTGMFTHFVNTLSNAYFAVQEMTVTQALAQGLDGGPKAVARHYSIAWQALMHSLADVKAAAVFGLTQEFPAAHFEALTKARPQTRQELLDLGGNKWMDNHGGALPGTLGRGVRTVGFSPLGAMDLLFKLAPYRYSIAMQQAKNPGKPVDFKKAVEFAEFGTFQTKLGKLTGQIPQVIADFPVLGFLLPYVKTLVNLIKVAATMDPLLSTAMHSNDMLGANGKDAQRLGFARVMVSFALAAAVLALYGEGDDDEDNLLQGAAPLDPKERALWETSHTSLGLKVGDGRLSLQRIEPLAGAATLIIADKKAASELSEGEFVEAMKTLATAWGQLVIGKSFMKTPADALAAAMDVEGRGDKFAERQAASIIWATLIPNFFSQLGDMTDPVKRETVNPWTDTPLRRLPWTRDSLDPQLDWAGREVANPRHHTLSPLAYEKEAPSSATRTAEWLLRNDVPLEAQPKGLKQDEENGRRLSLGARREILQHRAAGLAIMPDAVPGITAELQKMKMGKKAAQRLKDAAREATTPIKTDTAEEIDGRRWAEGVERIEDY